MEEALAVPGPEGSFHLGRAWWAPADELQQLRRALSWQSPACPCRTEQPSKA